MARSKALIIAFYGIDGAGKTTLADLLARILRKKQIRVYSVRLRSHHTLMYLLIRVFFALKGYDYKSIQGMPILLNYIIKQYFGKQRLYIVLEVASVLAWYIIKVIPRKIFGRKPIVFIAERFLPDFIVMLHYTSGISDDELLKIYRFLEKLMHLNIIYFYVYVDPHLAITRKREERLHPSFTLYLASRYERINAHLHHYTIDTMRKTPSEPLLQVLSYLKNLGLGD
jgi:thymidylate kinase